MILYRLENQIFHVNVDYQGYTPLAVFVSTWWRKLELKIKEKRMAEILPSFGVQLLSVSCAVAR